MRGRRLCFLPISCWLSCLQYIRAIWSQHGKLLKVDSITLQFIFGSLDGHVTGFISWRMEVRGKAMWVLEMVVVFGLCILVQKFHDDIQSCCAGYW